MSVGLRGEDGGVTLPSGSGDLPTIDFDYTTLASPLAGTAARLSVDEVTAGSAPLGGSFALSYGGSQSTDLRFDADASAVEAALEAMPSIGGVTVSREVSARHEIDAVTVSPTTGGGGYVMIATADVTSRIAPGDLITIGADMEIGTCELHDGDSEVRVPVSVREELRVDDRVRIAGVVYTVNDDKAELGGHGRLIRPSVTPQRQRARWALTLWLGPQRACVASVEPRCAPPP